MPAEAIELFAIDCSLTMAWYFPDESSPYADAVARGLKTREAVAPSIWPLEVANVLAVGERRRRCTEAQSATFLARLKQLPIRIDDDTSSRAWGETIQLARTQRLSAYDAAYLEVAMRRGIPIATLDDGIKRAAKAVGVALFTT
jgi:predicted nucleic acid-binding protein